MICLELGEGLAVWCAGALLHSVLMSWITSPVLPLWRWAVAKVVLSLESLHQTPCALRPTVAQRQGLRPDSGLALWTLSEAQTCIDVE